MNGKTIYYAVTSLFLLLMGSMMLYDMAVRYNQQQQINWWGLILGIGFIVQAVRGCRRVWKSVTV